MRGPLPDDASLDDALLELSDYVRHSAQMKARGKSRALQALVIVRKHLGADPDKPAAFRVLR